jgi:glutathione S-transferase
MPERDLVTLSYSPWSERARWVLDHHALSYRKIPHAPVLGERRLRRLSGKKSGRVTVPLLLVDGAVIGDSFDIALYADREGSGAPLIPQDAAPDVRAWNDRADALLSASRALFMGALLRTPEALDETLPLSLPRWLRAPVRPLARAGARLFVRKYALDLDDAPRQEAAIRAVLDELRARLSNGAPYILGTFTYADIVMATSLQGVSPVADRYIRLGPATRRLWTRDELAREYADLIAWRDALYQSRRSPARAA